MEDHNHDHSDEQLEVIVPTEGVAPVTELHNEDHSSHSHEGLDGLWEVMFGWEHVLAEVFWNTVWLGAAFAIGRLVTFRRVHKYIDDRHGVKHNKENY